VETILEIRAVKIESNGLGLVVVCLYRSPAGDFCQFLNLLEQVLLFLYRPFIEFLICGDFNVDYLLNSAIVSISFYNLFYDAVSI
jgi:hypothetical protein